MKIAEAFREAGFWFRVGDYQFRLTCLCGTDQTLDACPTTDRDGVTVYTCPRCGDAIAGVTLDATTGHVFPDASRSSDVEGHRMCGYVFGAKVDMELWPAAAVEPYMDIPRRPAFFTSRGLA